MIDTLIKNLDRKEKVTRDELQELAIELSKVHDNIFFNWVTRLGKSLTIMKIAKYHNYKKVLMVNAQQIHIDNFKKDALQHNIDISNFTCICWNSYDKYIEEDWDLVIQDEIDFALEAHMSFLEKAKWKRVFFLSATINYEQERLLKSKINYYKWKITFEQAINWGILPLPTIWLKTISLTDIQKNQLEQIVNKIEYYKEICEKNGWKKWKQLDEKQLNKKLETVFTDEPDLDLRLQLAVESNPFFDKEEVDTYEAMQVLINGGLRKKFFEKVKKEWFDKNNIFKRLSTKRTLFFLPNIKANQKYGNAVSSLESKSENKSILDDFNAGKIDYIISNKILIRGVNLYNIDWAYFGIIDMNGAALNQSFGRVLLGVSPNILAVCCEGTKEEIILHRFIKKTKIIPKIFP